MSELDDYGAEFYLGDPSAIGKACAEYRRREPRSGVLADDCAGFPACVHSVDVLHLSRAIAVVTGGPEVRITERHERLPEKRACGSPRFCPWRGSVRSLALLTSFSSTR